MAKPPFNLNRRLIVSAGVLTILASALVLTTGSEPAMLLPLLPGIVAAFVMIFYHPRWMYLVAGILAAAFPLVILFVFGAYQGLLHPGGGAEGHSLWLLALAAAVGLIGGIAGFVQSRSGTAPPANEILRAPQGVAAVLLATFVVGMIVSSALAEDTLRALVQSPADLVEAEASFDVAAKDFAFEPRVLSIPTGKTVALRIDNQDGVIHTFSYSLDGKTHEAVLPAHSATQVFFRVTEPQTIEYWCAPHSMGEDDTSPDSMVGTLRIE